MSQQTGGRASNNEQRNSQASSSARSSSSSTGPLAYASIAESQSKSNNNNNINSVTLKEFDSAKRSSSATGSQRLPHPDQQQQHRIRESGGQTTSSSQRLSSIEILNENRQRQLQFKQQESFKQHLEQRQKLIQQQQRDSKDDLTYQVNTSAPDFMASAIASNKAGEAKADSRLSGNPFSREEAQETAAKSSRVAGAIKKPSSTPSFEKKPAASTVSGKDGFLSGLMDEASSEASGRLDRSQEELNTGKTGETRYANVTAERNYNYYDDNPDKRAFYEKDLGTLLQECRGSRKLVIAIVAIALLLDNMLLTSVVPIIPFDLLKNRMERKHNELLMKQQLHSNKSLSSGARQRMGPDGTIGNDDDADEKIAKMIGQSIVNAKSRYTGSVFHPRVRPGNEKQPQQQQVQRERNRDYDNNDDDDDDDDDDRGRANHADGSNRKGKDNDESDVQSGDSKSRRPTNEMRNMQSPSRQSMPEDDYEQVSESGDDDDDEATPTGTSPRPGNMRREQKQKVSGRPNSSTRKPKLSSASVAGPNAEQMSPTGEDGRKDGVNDADDDDDEDSANSKRWLNLKSSLFTMARRTGNDTDALANTCLSSVLGSGYQRSMQNGGADDMSKIDKDDDDDNSNPKAPLKIRSEKKRERRSPRIERRKLKLIRPTPRAMQSSTEKPPEKEAGNKAEELTDMSTVSHQDIVDESFEVGVMFASKPIVQAFANPFIGTLTNRVGFTIPMFTGFVIMFISTLVFAFGSSYSTLFIARAIQGVGSACTSVAGMSMLADRFPDDAERGNAMAIALGGLALGVVIGPPFGGFMYEFVGRSSPFIILSFLALLDGLLQLLVLQPRVTKSHEEGASLMTLIKDPYILVAAGAITFANTGIAILEPALPLWMMDTMQAKNWEQGVAFLPAALSYMFGTNLFGNLGHKIGRWRSTMIGLIVIGFSLLLIPFATRVDHLIIPNGAIGFAMGMVDSTMMPMLGYLVDIRHTSVYGSVYAIGDVAFCASFAFGPALSGTLVELIGFEGLIITTALICFCFAPLLLLLRNPPPRQLNEAQMQEQSTLRYVNYNHLDSPDEEAHLTDYNKSREKAYVR